MKFFTLRTGGANFTVFLVILFVLMAVGTFAYLQRTDRLAGYKVNMFSGIVADDIFLEEEDVAQDEVEELSIGVTGLDVIQEEEEEEQEELDIFSSGAKEYKETAKNGDGITKLARRALERYSDENVASPDLSPEHKVFVEDYIQNRIGDRGLEMGETITISEDLIVEAINESQNLSVQELEHLKNFSELVWHAGF